MAFLTWKPGRQGTGYLKMLLLGCPWIIPFDLYLLKYPIGTIIPPHTDPVQGRKHYRLNIELVPAETPVFVCDNCIFRGKYFAFFRPDTEVHSVSQTSGRTRYVLSLGFLFGKL